MNTFQPIYDRILNATKTRTQNELAEILGIKQSSISDAKRRGSVPADWYITLFEKFGLNPSWLKTGSGNMCLSTEYSENNHLLAEEESFYGSKSNAVLIPVYSCTPREGTNNTLEAVDIFGIPTAFASPEIKVVLIGNSAMDPTIRRNAYIGVNCEIKTPCSGDIFAVFLPPEGLILRRVYVDFDKDCICLRSDTPNYPELNLSTEDFSQHVLGRVAWVLQDLQ